MRFLFLLLFFLLSTGKTTAQTATCLVFGKLPKEQFTKADIQRELNQSNNFGRIPITRFIKVNNSNYKVVSFQVEYVEIGTNDSIFQNKMGPFKVQDESSERNLPNEVFKLLHQLSVAGGRLFIDEIQIRKIGEANVYKFNPIVFSIR